MKIDGVRQLGGEVVLAGETRSAEQAARAEDLAPDEGLTLIPPFDHPDVIAGQGTVGLEILEQWPEVGTILVPVGGGGLLAGICGRRGGACPGRGSRRRRARGRPKLSAALAAGGPRTLAQTESLADGLLSPVGRHPHLASCAAWCAEAVAVTEEEIAAGRAVPARPHRARVSSLPVR